MKLLVIVENVSLFFLIKWRGKLFEEKNVSINITIKEEECAKTKSISCKQH